jgi:hypothetical protein
MSRFAGRVSRLEKRQPAEQEDMTWIFHAVRPGEVGKEPNEFEYRPNFGSESIHSHRGESSEAFIARVREQHSESFLRIYARYTVSQRDPATP